VTDTAPQLPPPAEPGDTAYPASGPPGPSRPASDARAAGLLADLVRRVASSLDLQQTLQLVVQAVVDQLGFGAAVVNMVRPGDLCEVVAVAGPEEVSTSLLGTRAPMDTWRTLLASCEPWGELRFLDHRRDQRVARTIASWVPPMEPSDAPDAWHREDMLLAPLYAAGGALIGVLSVDMPLGGRTPDAQRRQLLEQFAVHAALAIEHSRVHTVMADSEQLFRAMFDRSPIAIALRTTDDRITRVNAACEQLLGRDAAELLGRTAAELSRPEAAPHRRTGDSAASPHEQYEIHFHRPDGSEVWGRVNSTLLATEASESPSLVLTQIEDITLLRSMQARFAYAATHDQLTGLPNRALVLERLTAAMAGAHRDGGRVAVLFCDLDHFKDINDTLGHAAGDQMLTEIGYRLQRTAREQDTVGRFGGDEFVVICYPVLGPAAVAGLATRLMRAVREPLTLAGEPVVPSMSVGVALSAVPDSADAALAHADRALYAAKAAGRGRWRLATVQSG
jgi:diguanylate cyclase (GGDEF)-like protein/PAS domain S-box-containing protein